MADVIRSSPSGPGFEVPVAPVPNSDLAPMAANTVKCNPTATSAKPSDFNLPTNTALVRQGGNIVALSIGANTVLGRQSGDVLAAPIIGAQVAAAAIDPTKLAPLANRVGNAFVSFQVFAAGTPGAPDDVTVFNANCPLGCQLLDVMVLVSTAIALSSVQLRSASGGGGTTLSSVLSTATTGTRRDDDVQTYTLAANSSLFLRRSDAGVAGSLICTFVPV